MAARKGEQEYKDESQPVRLKSEQVQMWRDRIANAKTKLEFDARIADKELANRYLSGDIKVPTSGKGSKAHKAYINYALPLLKELFRGAIPRVPTPSVEPRTEKSDATEKSVSQFLDFLFDKHEETLIKEIDKAQWDDSKFGCFVLRADWKQKTVPADPLSDISEENMAIAVRRASEENLNTGLRIIADSDLDEAHIRVHEEFIMQIDPVSPDYQSLERHIQEHRSRLSTVTEEGVRFERVRGEWYTYDPDHGWSKRGWEAEYKQVRVQDLINNGYKNVTPENAPPDNASSVIPYEDKVVGIYEIHDRLNKMEYVIAARGPETGKFLMERPWRYGELDIYRLDAFNEYNPDQSWGLPLMYSMIPVLERLAVVDYYIDVHVVNHAINKTIIPNSAGSNQIKRDLKDPNKRFVSATNEQAMGIKDLTGKPIPDTLLQDRALLLNELRRIVGLDAQDTGESNPHQVSATESFARSTAGAGRIEDRQKQIANVLSWAGKMFLELYRNYAMMAVEVKIFETDELTGILGPKWTIIQPADLPVDIDISFDIETVTDKGAAEEMARSEQVYATVMASPLVTDPVYALMQRLKDLGVDRPGKYLRAGIPGPENSTETKGRPGTPGSGVAPVGTDQNAEANKNAQASFGGGVDKLQNAQNASGASATGVANS